MVCSDRESYGVFIDNVSGLDLRFRNSCIVVARVSTTHCRGCIIGYVCIAYMNPLVGIALVVKSFLLCLWNYCYVYNLSHRLYIYILLFCGDPFFHLRAHPTQMMG